MFFFMGAGGCMIEWMLYNVNGVYVYAYVVYTTAVKKKTFYIGKG